MSSDVIRELERWLEDLTRRWERYFARDPKVPLPPERERAALERRLREASRQELRTTVEQFRLEQLLHRFATFNALWQRQLREREEARVAAAHAGAATPDVPRSTTVDSSGDDYRRLHENYLAALQESGNQVAVNFERFRDTLHTQRRMLEERGAVVEGFEVVREGSQVKLKARVRRGRNE